MARVLALVLFLVSLTVSARPFGQKPARAPASDPTYVALRQMRPAQAHALLTPVTLRREAGSLSFHRGTFYFFTPIGGRLLGALFEGEGSFAFSPPDEVERTFLAHFAEGGTLQDAFSWAVFYFTDRTEEELRPHLRALTSPPPKSVLERFEAYRRVVRRKLKRAVEMRLLADLYAPHREGFFLALLEGKKNPKLLFGLDPLGFAPQLPSTEEVGLASYEEMTEGIWALCHRSGESNVEDEDHREYDITHHRLQVRVDRGGRLDVRAEITFVPRHPHLRVIRFALFPTLRVESAWDAAGRPLPFIQEEEDEGGALALISPTPLPAHVPQSVSLAYGGRGAVISAGPGTYLLVPEARSTWYPNNWQMPFGDRALFEITFVGSRDQTLVGTGHPQARDPESSHWTSPWPLTAAGFNLGSFDVRRREEAGFVLEVYTNRTEPDEIRRVQIAAEQLQQRGVRLEIPLGTLTTSGLAENALTEALTAVRLFVHYFGPHPYGRIALSQQPAAFFGQSWPMLIYLPYTAFLDGTHRYALGLPVRFSEFTDVLGPHEIAHQWWGHLVSWKSYRDQWISEGLADFAAALYLQWAFHPDPQRRLKRFLDFWRGQRELITQKALLGIARHYLEPSRVGPLVLGVRLDTGRTQGAYQRLAYAKGAFVFHMLRMMMREAHAPLGQGDDRFIALMHDFTRTYAHRAASTRDLQALVEKHMTREMDLEGTGRMDWFFRQWVYGTAIPHYTLQYRIRPTPEGTYRLWFTLTQGRVPRDFQMLVPLYLDYGEGRLVRLGTATLRGVGAVQTEVTLATRPRRVVVNALEDVLSTKEEREVK